MAIFQRGSISLDLGFISLTGELSEEDRQTAWRLYTQIVTRTAVTGKLRDDRESFEGEVLTESLNSLYGFFQVARELMSDFPVGRISVNQKKHLGFFIVRMLALVLRPFLEKWQANFRRWAQQHIAEGDDVFVKQREYPHLEAMLEDWGAVRRFFRAAAKELAEQYELVDVQSELYNEVGAGWGPGGAQR